MTAEDLAEIIRIALTGHPDVVEIRRVATVYADRVALGVEDRDRQLWRIHILREPLR